MPDEYAIHQYQDVRTVSNIIRRQASFDVVGAEREDMILRLSAEVVAKKVDAQTHEIIEEPVWRDARAHYVASLPEGFRKRFLTYFWGLSEDVLTPRRIKHTVTVERWTEHPEVGVPKQSIEDTLGFWA